MAAVGRGRAGHGGAVSIVETGAVLGGAGVSLINWCNQQEIKVMR